MGIQLIPITRSIVCNDHTLADPPVADQAPTAGDLTPYDQEHLVIYLLVDADAEGADWAEAAQTILHIDPAAEPERARRAWGATWHAPNGCSSMITGTCSEAGTPQ
jgi:hypothetical protein